MVGAALAARAVVAEPLAAAHQTTAMRLRGEVQELEEQAREKDQRIGSLYGRLRAQAQTLAEAEAHAAAAHGSSGRFPALIIPGGPGSGSVGGGGGLGNLEREERLAAELESSKAALRRLQADLAQGPGGGEQHRRPGELPASPSTPEILETRLVM